MPGVTVCPVENGKFKTQAEPLIIRIGDRMFTASPCEFSTGSVGWRLNEKITVTIKIDGREVPVQVQLGANLTLVGSKPKAKAK
jgi:hypothetical protein